MIFGTKRALVVRNERVAGNDCPTLSVEHRSGSRHILAVAARDEDLKSNFKLSESESGAGVKKKQFLI
jgi:hypothetical protein